MDAYLNIMSMIGMLFLGIGAIMYSDAEKFSLERFITMVFFSLGLVFIILQIGVFFYEQYRKSTIFVTFGLIFVVWSILLWVCPTNKGKMENFPIRIKGLFSKENMTPFLILLGIFLTFIKESFSFFVNP